MPVVERQLRSDLVVSRQETPDGPVFVFKDPATQRFFRLREAEYFIARQLDGATPLDVVRERVVEHFGGAPEALEAFVAQLDRLGLLAQSGAAQQATPARQSPMRGTMLWLRLKAVDPDRLFDRLIGRVRVFFTPRFVAVAATLILWAFGTVLVNREDIGRDLARLWSLHSLLFVWVTILAVTTAHEFAHGLTCKHFGGHVHELGFLLIYFQPAFYCNVSDSWLFPERSKRLWVMFAGGFFELFLWALAALVWRVTERSTWVNDAALVVMATSGVRTFFNWNPLIKLDGYYILSDYLEVPNLRQRAFAYLGAGLRRLWGGAVAPAAVEATVRERRVFLAYGLLAATFSYWLLSQILLRFGAYLTDSYQGWGFLLFAGIVGATFQSPLRRAYSALVTPGPDGRRSFTHRAKTLVLAGLVGVLLWLVPLELTVGGEFVLLPAGNADVRAEVEGIVERVYVDEGARVATGDTIARLSDREYQARLRMVEAELEEKRAKLRLLVAGPRREEIQVARIAVDKAQERLRYAGAELERLRSLARLEAASRAELEQAEERAAVVAKELAEAQARLAQLRAGSRPEEIAAVEQDIAHSEAERRRLEDQLASVTVTAPHAGVITTPRPREKVGEFVKPGDLIAEVHAVESVTAEIAVAERDIGDVRVGQRGALRFRAYPGRTFEGPVAAVAPAAMAEEDRAGRVVKVTIELPNPDGLLKPEMTGYARIYGGERRALDILTRRFRRFIRLEFWSWW